jgi:hypothetical protein
MQKRAGPVPAGAKMVVICKHVSNMAFRSLLVMPSNLPLS